MSKDEAKNATSGAQNEHLNLKVKSQVHVIFIQDGEEVFFKIKSTTQLKKLMDAYCQRQGLASNNVRFLFDGERLHETQTPKELNMENGDEIDVLVEQVGGRQ